MRRKSWSTPLRGTPRRRPGFARMGLLIATASMGLVALWTLPAPPADACMGSPPLRCGRSTALAKAVPVIFVLAPFGGVANVPVRVIISSLGPCPVPLTTTITLNLTCVPPPNAVATIVIPTPAPGVYNAIVPVVIPPGPPRICIVRGAATTTWADGVLTRGRGDVEVCIVEEAPGQPSVPRLDLELLTPAGQSAHPGDGRTHRYRLTNNDPMNSVTVTLDADSEQVARLSEGVGMIPGSGNNAIALSDPGTGDNFPIAFGDTIPNGCVPLPPDPMNYPIPVITRTITLAPGDTQTVDIATRSWPMCANGSCGEQRVRVRGVFDDGTDALACASALFSVDTSVPPDFAWPDSGMMPFVFPQADGLGLQGNMPTHQIQSAVRVVNWELFTLDGQPIQPAGVQSEPQEQTRGRISARNMANPPLNVGRPFRGFVLLEHLNMNPMIDIEIVALELHSASPIVGDTYFSGNVRSRVTGPSIPPTLDSFFDVFFLMSINGSLGGSGDRFAHIDQASAQLTQVDSTHVQVQFDGVFQTEPGVPLIVDQIALNFDFGSCATGVPSAPPCPGDVDGDGDVDLTDLSILLSQFGTTGPNLAGDLDNDGDVDLTDLAGLLSRFGTVC